MANFSKILYIITQSSWGGAQKYVFNLATELRQNYPETEIAVAGGQESVGELVQKLATASIRFIPIKNLVRNITPKELIRDIFAIAEIKKIILQEQPTVVHLNSSKAGVIGSLASWLIRRKNKNHHRLVYTVHGWVFHENLAQWKKMIYLGLEKITAPIKDGVICLSKNDRQAALKNKILPAEKVSVIYNGIDLEKTKFLTREGARQALNLNSSATIIGTIANFFPTKNLRALIAATEIIIKSHPEIITAIIGDGPEKKLLENLISEKKLQKNILLLGQKENAAQYLKVFDVYVLPSVKEGLPYSLLEAMAAAIPVVTTDVGGIAEIITDQASGLLVAPNQIEIMAKKIMSLIENKSLAESLSRQAMAKVKQLTNAETIVQTAALYQKIIS